MELAPFLGATNPLHHICISWPEQLLLVDGVQLGGVVVVGAEKVVMLPLFRIIIFSSSRDTLRSNSSLVNIKVKYHVICVFWTEAIHIRQIQFLINPNFLEFFGSRFFFIF